MAAPNSTYVAMFPLQEQIWDSLLNIPLAAGVVKFFQDSARTVAKDVYAQTGSPGSYVYTSIGSELTLSSIGTFVNPNDGTNIIPFLWPFHGDPASPPSPLVAESYFIQVFSAEDIDTPQFTVQDWPPNSGSSASLSGITTVNVQTFLTPGSTAYTPTPGMTYCVVQVLGGGGGGGGCAISGAGNVTAGGPGGAGAYSEGFYPAATIGTSQTVVVGAGGTAGATTPSAGGNGGASAFGTLLTAPGGTGGADGVASNTYYVIGGGAGGVAGVGGYLNSPGQSGSYSFGFYPVAVSGVPGSTPYGSGSQTSTGSAAAGSGYGAGGGAGSDNNAGAARSGAAGRGGFVIVTEYIS